MLAGSLAIVGLVATLVLATFPPPAQPGGPADREEIGLGNLHTSYGSPWVWYNLTITLVKGDISWYQTTVLVANGTYSHLDANSSVCRISSVSNNCIAFTRSTDLSSGHWTSSSTDPVEVGTILALQVDTPQTGGCLGIAWAGPPIGSLCVGSLP